MRPRDWFGVVVRTIGLLTLIAGLMYIGTAIFTITNPVMPRDTSPLGYVVCGISVSLVGLYFLRGIPGLMGWCYPKESEERSAELLQ